VFTGIIRQIGTVRTASGTPAGRRLGIDLGAPADGLRRGDSVAVSGACLTAAEVEGRVVTFDVVSETLERTTLGRLAPGGTVNLERALALGDRLDGHLVQGHVDGIARVTAVGPEGSQWRLECASPQLAAEMVAKGSVAIDGVSLTLTDVTAERFAVALVPETLSATTLGDLAVGDPVNVELDLIGKYVRKYLTGLGPAGGLTLDKLRGAGFA